MDSIDDLGYFDNYATSSRKRKCTIRPQLSKQDHFDALDEEKFRRRYRMSKTSFEKLLQMIENGIKWVDHRNDPTPNHIQLQVALRFYATGSFQQVSGDLVGLSQPTISRIVKRVSISIAKLSDDYQMSSLSFQNLDNVMRYEGYI